MVRHVIALAALAALAGCKSPAPGPGTASLNGTGWRLLAIEQSTPVAMPGDPSNYQLMLLPGGELVMKLGCNRGTGKWSYTPAGNNNGNFSLSPVAMTRAFCGPGSIDTKIAQDAPRIRSYALVGDRLSLDLDANGGRYVWERIPE